MIRLLMGLLLVSGVEIDAQPAEAAPTTPAPVAPAPASEALVERFMAALPEAQRLNRVDRTADRQELDRLGAMNQGRADDIRPILEEFAACASAARNKAIADVLRRAARQLGEEKLGRLIQFYEREDVAALREMMAQGTAALSDAQRAEAARIAATYPVAEFADLLEPGPTLWRADFMREEGRCAATRDAALERAGLRTR